MYLGNDLQVAFPTYRPIDDISTGFNGSTTSFALLVGGSAPAPLPINAYQCLISVAGVVQKPDPTGASGFNLSGGNIVFSSAPTSGQSFFGVILAGADYINVGANFPDGSATAPSITFDQNNNTGFYRLASGTIGFTSNGANAASFGSNYFIAPSFIPTSSSAPTNGLYLSASNTLGLATNGSGRLFIDGTGRIGVGTSSLIAKFTISGNSVGVPIALIDTSTITPDFGAANHFTVTLSGSRTLANPTNLTAGQSGTIVITQDSTGSRTLSYGSYWKFSGGVAPILTTTANAVDVLVYYVESSTRITTRLIPDVR